MLDPIIEQKMDSIAESIFRTSRDADQIPVTKESGRKLDKLTPHWIQYELDEKENPISWVVVLPTSLDLMEKFLKGEITERQLLDLTKPQEIYQAIYLCAAITIPKYRRKGLAIKLLKKAIDSIPHTEDTVLFAWPYSKEGAEVIKKLETELGVKVLIKKSK